MQDINLEVFGSFEQNQTKSKIIIGHNNTKYVVGGRARFNIRSNILDWRANKSPDQIKDIFNIPKDVKTFDDPNTICEFLDELINLDRTDFIKCMENTLHLNESLIIQLRRLFYIIVEFDKDDKYHVEFCPFEPVKRIETLLDLMPELQIDEKYADKIDAQVANIGKHIAEKHEIYNRSKNDQNKLKNDTEQNDTDQNLEKKMEKKMEEFIKLYELYYDDLDKIEKINIEIAQNLELISINIIQ